MSRLIKDRVKELEKTNRLITDNLVDAVWVVDATRLTYEYITPSIWKISGYTAEELIGTRITDRMTADSSREVKTLLDEVLKDFARTRQETRSTELELSHKDGDTYWVEVRAKLAEEDNGPPKLIGITRDITVRKRAELQLRRLNRDLSAAVAEKDRLAREIKLLRDLLPVCSGCKRIRDEAGRWWPMDEYIRSHTDSDFTHTICPDCKAIFYPDIKG